MEYKDTIKKIISASGGIAKLSALTSAGVPKEKYISFAQTDFFSVFAKVITSLQMN